MNMVNTVIEALGMTLLAFTFVLTLASLIRYSSILIKLVCLEVLSNLLLACIAFWSAMQQKAVFIDISLAIALIMFLGVVAYYHYLSYGVTQHE